MLASEEERPPSSCFVEPDGGFLVPGTTAQHAGAHVDLARSAHCSDACLLAMTCLRLGGNDFMSVSTLLVLWTVLCVVGMGCRQGATQDARRKTQD